jgi:hypothetical protein
MKHQIKLKKTLSVLITIVLLMTLTIPAYAVNSEHGTISDDTTGYTYTAPTQPMTVDDNIITATAHRAASPVLGMLGLNAVSGFGMINGTAPSDLETAEQCAALGVWGTSLNENPDPYYWNYFYNFYAAENSLETSSDALLNGAWSGSPMKADTTLFEEYGNVSGSLSTRPDIVVGCSSANSGTDTDGYNDQLATIHAFTADSPYYQEGDEPYSPKLVSYQPTYITQMIESIKRLADAVTEVENETGKTTRYGDVQTIAGDYEKYVYGIISYVQEELAAKGAEEKNVAVLTAINEDGTYTIADSLSTSSTSLVRAYEYCMCVANSMTDIYGTTLTLDQLLEADAIVTINNQNITRTQLLESFGDKTYDGTIISNTPATLYGMTMNSVENAMGYAYIIGSLYCDVIDISPVELCAYFYQHILHISDLDGVEQVVRTNFSETILPEGISATLPSDYSAAKIEPQLLKGMKYYVANTAKFSTGECALIGLDSWVVNYGDGIGSTYKPACVSSAQSFTLNGKAVTPEAYNIDGNNYVKLRDMAYLLIGTSAACDISFDAASLEVYVVSGGTYKPVGGELTAGKDNAASCVYSAWTLLVDGEEVPCMVYNIGGNNYFKLLDLGNALGLEIGYDAATNTATITVS